MLNKEDKQNVAKVKKLIRTRDLEKLKWVLNWSGQLITLIYLMNY